MKRVFLLCMLILAGGLVNAATSSISANSVLEPHGVPINAMEPSYDLDVDDCEVCDFRPGSFSVFDLSECRKGFAAGGSSITLPCSITDYSWDFGDSNTGSGSAVIHEYDTSGTFEVCLTITYVNAEGEECSERVCRTIEVEGCIDACEACDFSPGSFSVTDISECRKGFSAGGSSITAPCSITDYSWDFGDSNTGSGSAVIHEYDTSGTFEVCLTITYINAEGEECSERVCRTIEVEGCIDACEACDFSPGSFSVTDISECRKGFSAGGSSITAPCSITDYSWDFGDSNTGSGSAVIHEYDTSGTFEVCLTITYINAEGEECSERVCRTIEVEGCIDACEACDFSPGSFSVTDISECRKGFSAGGSSITAPCSITDYSWDFGDSNTGSGSAVIHEYDTSGTFEVCLTITYINAEGEECSERVCRTIEVEGCIDACEACDFSPGSFSVTDISECRKGFAAGGSSITAPCSITDYSWDFGDSNTGSGSAVIHEYDTSGTFEVCLTITYVNAEGEECSERVCRTIEVEGCIDACEACDFSPGSFSVTDISECRKGFLAGGSSITAPCSITDYSWDFGDSNTGSGSAVIHEYDTSGTFEVCLTITYVNAEGEECTERICRTIEVEGCEDPCEECRFSPGSFSVTDISECRKGFLAGGSSITFPCSIANYEWDFGDSGTGTGSAVIHTYDTDGTYEVCLRITYVNGAGVECSEVICRTIVVEGCGDSIIGPSRGAEKAGGNTRYGAGSLEAVAQPNPANNEVTITVFNTDGKVGQDQFDIVIRSLDGSEVYRSIIINGNAKQIDISHLQTGIYLYEIFNAEGLHLVEKLMVK